MDGKNKFKIICNVGLSPTPEGELAIGGAKGVKSQELNGSEPMMDISLLSNSIEVIDIKGTGQKAKLSVRRRDKTGKISKVENLKNVVSSKFYKAVCKEAEKEKDKGIEIE